MASAVQYVSPCAFGGFLAVPGSTVVVAVSGGQRHSAGSLIFIRAWKVYRPGSAFQGIGHEKV